MNNFLVFLFVSLGLRSGYGQQRVLCTFEVQNTPRFMIVTKSIGYITYTNYSRSLEFPTFNLIGAQLDHLSITACAYKHLFGVLIYTKRDVFTLVESTTQPLEKVGVLPRNSKCVVKTDSNIMVLTQNGWYKQVGSINRNTRGITFEALDRTAKNEPFVQKVTCVAARNSHDIYLLFNRNSSLNVKSYNTVSNSHTDVFIPSQSVTNLKVSGWIFGQLNHKLFGLNIFDFSQWFACRLKYLSSRAILRIHSEKSDNFLSLLVVQERNSYTVNITNINSTLSCVNSDTRLHAYDWLVKQSTAMRTLQASSPTSSPTYFCPFADITVPNLGTLRFEQSGNINGYVAYIDMQNSSVTLQHFGTTNGQWVLHISLFTSYEYTGGNLQPPVNQVTRWIDREKSTSTNKVYININIICVHFPTSSPTVAPSQKSRPSNAPTTVPSGVPTAFPSFTPTSVPSGMPTQSPTRYCPVIVVYLPTGHILNLEKKLNVTSGCQWSGVSRCLSRTSSGWSFWFESHIYTQQCNVANSGSLCTQPRFLNSTWVSFETNNQVSIRIYCVSTAPPQNSTVVSPSILGVCYGIECGLISVQWIIYFMVPTTFFFFVLAMLYKVFDKKNLNVNEDMELNPTVFHPWVYVLFLIYLYNDLFDIWFALSIYPHPFFYPSILVVFMQYIFSFFALFVYQRAIRDELSHWYYSTFLLCICSVPCCGSFAAMEFLNTNVLNCRVSDWKVSSYNGIFSMGLTLQQLRAYREYRFWVVLSAQNIPQLMIILASLSLNLGDKGVAVVALGFTIASIVVSIFNLLVHYVKVEHEYDLFVTWETFASDQDTIIENGRYTMIQVISDIGQFGNRLGSNICDTLLCACSSSEKEISVLSIKPAEVSIEEMEGGYKVVNVDPNLNQDIFTMADVLRSVSQGDLEKDCIKIKFCVLATRHHIKKIDDRFQEALNTHEFERLIEDKWGVAKVRLHLEKHADTIELGLPNNSLSLHQRMHSNTAGISQLDFTPRNSQSGYSTGSPGASQGLLPEMAVIHEDNKEESDSESGALRETEIEVEVYDETIGFEPLELVTGARLNNEEV